MYVYAPKRITFEFLKTETKIYANFIAFKTLSIDFLSVKILISIDSLEQNVGQELRRFKVQKNNELGLVALGSAVTLSHNLISFDNRSDLFLTCIILLNSLTFH